MSGDPTWGRCPFWASDIRCWSRSLTPTPGIKKPTTTPSVPSVERLISGIAIIPSSAIPRPCCAARICKKDRPPIDPFSIQDAQVLITALHRVWGEAQGNYDEFRFFTGLRPSEEIALVMSDYDAAHGVLSITKARVQGIDKDVNSARERSRSLSVSFGYANAW